MRIFEILFRISRLTTTSISLGMKYHTNVFNINTQIKKEDVSSRYFGNILTILSNVNNNRISSETGAIIITI